MGQDMMYPPTGDLVNMLFQAFKAGFASSDDTWNGITEVQSDDRTHDDNFYAWVETQAGLS